MPELPFYWLDYLVCGALGALVGGVELIARYRDDPQRAIVTVPGFLHIALNAAAGCLALWLLRTAWPLTNELKELRETLAPLLENLVSWQSGPGQPLNDEAAARLADLLREEVGFRVKEVLAAGFGALAILRASLMKVRIGDSDLSLGPGLITDVLLNATDRAVDRSMAAPRAEIVNDIMEGVSFEQAKVTLPSHCFRLMQNTTAEEEQQFALEVEALASATMSDKVKAMNLGLALLNIVGAKVLSTAVANLRNEFTASSHYMGDVHSHLGDLPFDWVRQTLPPLCLSLASASQEKRDEIAFELEAIESSGLDEWTRKRLLGLVLIKAVGREVFAIAAAELQDRKPDGENDDAQGAEATAEIVTPAPPPPDPEPDPEPDTPR
mgnify:CR=1 FL=1